jgi:hypothetical protein
VSTVILTGCSFSSGAKTGQTNQQKCLEQNGTYITDENGVGTCSLP